MGEGCLNQYICLKKDIEEEDYKKIKELQKICVDNQEINLKLELEFKLSLKKRNNSPLKAINEFLYCEENILIGYLGISSFGGNVAEITGMVHPQWRRKGIFTRLLDLAEDECRRRNFDEVLLLCDDNSEAGKAFIKATAAKYSFSEYKMKLKERPQGRECSRLTLRKAKNSDGEEIGKLNSIFFGNPNIQISYPEEEEKNNRITYMIEFQCKTIGKIRVESDNNLSYIYGFGLLPEYRGKGYGREALTAALNLIENKNIDDVYLDVAAENIRALNLYKSCGFVEESVMNYYELNYHV